MTDTALKREAFHFDEGSGCEDFSDKIVEIDKLPEFCRDDALIRLASYVPNTPVIPIPDPIPPHNCPCPKSSNPRIKFTTSSDCCHWIINMPEPIVCIPKIEYVEGDLGDGSFDIIDKCQEGDYDFMGEDVTCCPLTIIIYNPPKCSDYSVEVSNKEKEPPPTNFKIPMKLEGGGSSEKCKSDISLNFAAGGGGSAGVPCPYVKIRGKVKINGVNSGTVLQVKDLDDDEEDKDKDVFVNKITNQCEQNIKLKIELDNLSSLTCEDSPFGAKLEYIREVNKWRLTMTPGHVKGPFPNMDQEITLAAITWDADGQAPEQLGSLFWVQFIPEPGSGGEYWKLTTTKLTNSTEIAKIRKSDIVKGSVCLFELKGTAKEPKLTQIRCETAITGNLNTWPAWHAEAYGSYDDVYLVRRAPGMAVVESGGSMTRDEFEDVGVGQGSAYTFCYGLSYKYSTDDSTSAAGVWDIYTDVDWSATDDIDILVPLFKFGNKTVTQYVEGLIRLQHAVNAVDAER